MRGLRLRDFLTLSTGAALNRPFNVQAQQAERVHRIGFLSHASPTSIVFEPAFAAFRKGLRDLGYIEGKNLVIEWRWAEGQDARLAVLSTDLVGLGVECIVTHEIGVRFAKEATATIPIVVATMPDPVGEGLARSLARPSGNITGLSFMLPEIAAKRLEVLKEAVPGVSQVALLFDPGAQSGFGGIEGLQRAARKLQIVLEPIGIRASGELEAAFSMMAAREINALAVIEDPVITVNIGQVADLAIQHHLPSVGFKEWPEAGGLLTYDCNIIPMFRRTATYVDKILKGAKPGELPIEQPTKFELIVNLKTAAALDLTIPRSILARADEVIE
jgi:putative ABC transport system substrate-binding protein